MTKSSIDRADATRRDGSPRKSTIYQPIPKSLVSLRLSHRPSSEVSWQPEAVRVNEYGNLGNAYEREELEKS